MKQLLNEDFYLRRGKIPYGHNDRLVLKDSIYIDPNEQLPDWESSKRIIDQLKSFGAKFSHTLRTWGWQLEGIDEHGAKINPETVMNTKVLPALRFLKQNMQRQPHDDNELDGIAIGDGNNDNMNNTDSLSVGRGEEDDIMRQLQAAMPELEQNIQGLAQVAQTEEDPEAQRHYQELQEFKRQLVNIVNNEEFENMLQPVIELSKKLGYQYSLANTISIYIQDPDATDVQAESDWNDENRFVVPHAKCIWYTTPSGPRIYNTPRERNNKRAEMISEFGVDCWDELSSAQKIRIKKELDKRDLSGEYAHSYKMTPHYDIRFTEVIEGRQDLHNTVINSEAANEHSDATDESKYYLKVVAKLCAKENVKLPGRIVAMVNNENGEDSEANIGIVRDCVRLLCSKMLAKDYESKGGTYNAIKNADRDMFKRQIEICAWLVMKYLGYNLQSSINLMNLWNVNGNNVTYLFDRVSHIATKVYNSIRNGVQQELAKQRVNRVQRPERPVARRQMRGAMPGQLEEKLLRGCETAPWSSQQIAQYFGMGRMYEAKRSLQESTIKDDFYNLFEKIR